MTGVQTCALPIYVADVTFDMPANKMQVHHANTEPWRVTLVDTGEHTQTGGRLKRVAAYLDDQPFCFTYGDGVSDLDVRKTVELFEQQNMLAVVTAVQPAGRYGVLNIEQSRVVKFEEKPSGDGNWTNGGFFVLSPRTLDYIDADTTSWESAVLPRLAQDNQLTAYYHTGFWQPMDTMRDKYYLDELWNTGRAPWKVWADRKSTRLNSSHVSESRMPSSA